NVLFTRKLARMVQARGVTVNAVHPGAVATNIWSGAPRWVRPILSVAKRLFMLSPAAGARTLTFLATSPEIDGTTGQYFERNKAKQPSRLARDDAVAERLWKESARLVNLSV